MAYQDAGRLDQAITLLEADAGAAKSRHPGENTPTLIESMNDLAVAYWESGQPRGRFRFTSDASRCTGRLGNDHPDTLTMIDNLAVAYGAAGHTERAIPLHEDVLKRLTG